MTLTLINSSTTATLRVGVPSINILNFLLQKTCSSSQNKTETAYEISTNYTEGNSTSIKRDKKLTFVEDMDEYVRL